MAAMAQHVQGMLDLQKLGAATFDYGNNIRTFCVRARREQRVRLSGICAGLYPAVVLRRQRAVPLGRAFRRSFRHRADGSTGAGTISERRASVALDQAGAKSA